MRFNVRLTIRRMGRQCQTCKQEFETIVEAETAEDAVAIAKERTGANPDTHQFVINYVRGQ